MAYSYIKYTGTGSQANFTFPFPYLDAANLYATVDGELRYSTLAGPSTLQVVPTPAAGQNVKIFRSTLTATAPVDFVDGSVLMASDMDRLALFSLYALQEAADSAAGDGTTVTGGGTMTAPEILAALGGQITLTQFATDLASEIAKISGTSAVIGSVAWNMLQEANARTTAIGLEASARAAAILAEATARGTAVSAEASARTTADASIATSVTNLTSVVSGNTSAISTEATARTTADSALSTQITTQAASTLSAAGTAAASLVSTEATARTTADSALSTSISALSSTVTSGNNTLTSRIAAEESARVSENTSIANRVSSLESSTTGTGGDGTYDDTAITARITSAEQAITNETSARASAVSSLDSAYKAADSSTNAALTTESTTRSTADSALSTRASALESKVNLATGQTVTALIASEATARTNADSSIAGTVTTLQSSITGANGIGPRLSSVETQANTSTTALGVSNANYTLKVSTRTDGKRAVAGIGLNATSDGTVAQSELILLADKTTFVSSAIGLNETPQALLQVGPVNGVNTLIIPATRVGDQTVASRMIVDGTISARHIEAASITADRIDSRGLSIKNAEGVVIFSAGVPLPATSVEADPGWINSNVTLGGLGYTGEANATYGAVWGTSVTGQPADLAGINATEGAKLTGIAAGATVGATFGTNISGQITAANSTTFIANAAITNAQIGGDISSTNFVTGSAGWSIKKAGSAEFFNVTVRGNVQATSLNGAIVGNGNIGAGAISALQMVKQVAFAYTAPANVASGFHSVSSPICTVTTSAAGDGKVVIFIGGGAGPIQGRVAAFIQTGTATSSITARVDVIRTVGGVATSVHEVAVNAQGTPTASMYGGVIYDTPGLDVIATYTLRYSIQFVTTGQQARWNASSNAITVVAMEVRK